MKIAALLLFTLRDFSAPLNILWNYFSQTGSKDAFLNVIVLLWTTIFSPINFSCLEPAFTPT
jgi:hypothetical protein